MLGPKKVLIAEDSSVIQTLTKNVLQFEKFEITSAKNGKEVLSALNNENIDLILLDINMPVMDGIKCAQTIRKLSDKQKADVPIIAITGNAKNFTMDDFRAVGINDYLQKPIDFDQLIKTVKKWIGKAVDN